MSRRVFVVDDEKAISDSLTAILNLSGFTATAFYSAEGALSECGSTSPDFVISDVAMPGMNGVELAVVIKERFPACRILLFSGQATSVNVLEHAREKGHDFELLAKPVHPKELLAKLAKAEGQPLDFGAIAPSIKIA